MDLLTNPRKLPFRIALRLETESHLVHPKRVRENLTFTKELTRAKARDYEVRNTV